MVEQNESVDFKTLKARFQGENLKIQTKPLIPEKPRDIPPLPSKASNPLISSINTAVKKGTLHAPRVIFKDPNRQLSPTWGLKGNEQPATNSEPLDERKNEGAIVKKPMKDRNLPLVLPVPPVKPNTQDPKTSSPTHVSVSPAKESTPRNFVFNTTKTGKDLETDTVEHLTSAEPSPLTPRSVSPARVSTPKTFKFNNTNTANDMKTDTVEGPTPALRAFDYSSQNHRSPANPSITANAPYESVPLVPKALVPPQISAGERSVPSISAPSILARGIPASPSPEPKIPETVIPKPAIRSQALRNSEIPKAVAPVSDLSDVGSPKPNINLLSLSEVFPPPEESPPPDFTDIPPPIIPDEDFSDGDFSDQAIPSSIPASVTPHYSSPVVSRTNSPAPPKRSPVSPELLLNTSRPRSFATPSPPLASPKDVVLENAKSLSDKTEVNKESLPKSPLSFLARAEGMAPNKRTQPLDNRVFNLLEKAKRKSAISQLPTTDENTSLLDAPKGALSDAVTPDMAQLDLGPTNKVLPQIPKTVVNQPEAASAVPHFNYPPVDYVDHAHMPSKSHPFDPVRVNGLDHSITSPGVLTVVKPTNPPPPPPRKPLPTTPMVESPPETRKADHLQIPTTPAEHFEKYEDQPYDNSFEDQSFDTEEFEVPAVPNFRPVPPLDSGSVRPALLHDKAFLEQWNPTHHTMQETLPNVDYRDYGEGDYGSAHSGSPLPGAQASLLQNQMRHSPVIQDGLSSSGTLQNSDDVYEDLSVNRKGKTPKTKKQKGPPKNPYADASAIVEETPKKGLFSRKNSAKEKVDDKELKKKEKQREKEKEKEKERERKEQKEKEKKENEIKKKFKITGHEEAIYHVKVIEECKGRKNDLPVNVGETVSIIRTTSCPKGKWLAKDSSNRYGYVPVECMDLNIAGIKELGKMTTAISRPNGNALRDGEHTSTGSRTPDHYATNRESFSDDSEEWTCDDDDPAYGSPSETDHAGLNHMVATPAKGIESAPVHQPQRDEHYTSAQPKHEALQKLSTFFTQPKAPSQPPPINNAPIPSRMEVPKAENPVNLNEDEEDLAIPVFKVLPPPDLYADIIAGDSVPIYSKPVKTTTK